MAGTSPAMTRRGYPATSDAPSQPPLKGRNRLIVSSGDERRLGPMVAGDGLAVHHGEQGGVAVHAEAGERVRDVGARFHIEAAAFRAAELGELDRNELHRYLHASPSRCFVSEVGRPSADQPRKS